MAEAEIVDAGLSAGAARALTDRIKIGVEAVWALVTQAYTERAWSALGYRSWDDYCTREFGTSRIRLPREERAEVVASLRESGLSLRAIAAATGYSEPTVRRELAGASNDAPDAPSLITGTDGKSYPPKPQPAPKPAEAQEGGGWSKRSADLHFKVVTAPGSQARKTSPQSWN